VQNFSQVACLSFFIQNKNKNKKATNQLLASASASASASQVATLGRANSINIKHFI
jgi:hypothetical protein